MTELTEDMLFKIRKESHDFCKEMSIDAVRRNACIAGANYALNEVRRAIKGWW